LFLFICTQTGKIGSTQWIGIHTFCEKDV